MIILTTYYCSLAVNSVKRFTPFQTELLIFEISSGDTNNVYCHIYSKKNFKNFVVTVWLNGKALDFKSEDQCFESNQKQNFFSSYSSSILSNILILISHCSLMLKWKASLSLKECGDQIMKKELFHPGFEPGTFGMQVWCYTNTPWGPYKFFSKKFHSDFATFFRSSRLNKSRNEHFSSNSHKSVVY